MEGKNKYGSICGLPDEELADPEELERQLFLEEWGAILALPIRGGNPIKPNIDEYFGVDWGAFATMDFERTMVRFDKARYRIDKHREERNNILDAMEMIQRQLPSRDVRRVLEYVRKGVLDIGDIRDMNMYMVAVHDCRVRWLRQEIVRLQEARAERREREFAGFFG
jgi:hypothetical protein